MQYLGGMIAGNPAGSFRSAQMDRQKVDAGEAEAAGDAAFGRALQALYNAPFPGATPTTVPPGAPSMAAQPPQSPSPMGGGVPGGPQMPAGAMPPRPPAPIPGAMPQPMGGPPPQPGMPPGGGGPSPMGGPPGGPPQLGMPPSGGPQFGGQGGGITWQMAIQAVTQANPGIQSNPRALARAVDHFMPIMNQQSVADWRQQSLQLREEAIKSAEMRAREGQAGADRRAQMRGTPDGGEAAAQHIGDAVISGQQPPDLKGLYRMQAPVRGYLAQQGFDLSKAQREWQQAQRQITSLNAPQMQRFIGVANSVDATIDEVRNLSSQLDQSGIQLLNRAQLAAYIQTAGNTPTGQLATRYVTALNTLREEFANLAAGGYAPTESVWKLANRQLNENFGRQQMDASLSEIQRLVRYRLNAIPGLQQSGPGAPNRYTGVSGDEAPRSRRGNLSDENITRVDAQDAPAGAPKPPKPGDVKDGWRFKGGNPGEAANWEKVEGK